MVIEYFATYDLFAYGMYGSFIGISYFIAIALATTIPYVKKPLSKVFEILLPMYFVGFVLSFIGFPSTLTGIIVLVTYLVAMKKYMGLTLNVWIPIVVSFFGVITIFSFVPPQEINLMVGLLCLYLFTQGKIQMYKINKQINNFVT